MDGTSFAAGVITTIISGIFAVGLWAIATDVKSKKDYRLEKPLPPLRKIMEGPVRKGGINEAPKTSKPGYRPGAQPEKGLRTQDKYYRTGSDLIPSEPQAEAWEEAHS